MSELQIIVTGSRNWEDSALIIEKLSNACPDLIIQGGCPTGADKIARDFAEKHLMCKSKTVHANWNKYGRAAGPIRNKFMLESFPDAIVYAFCLEKSSGTMNCIKLANEMKRDILVWNG